MSDNFPFHEEFQNLVLAYLIRFKGALSVYSDEVLTSHFESTTNGTLYGYHVDYFSKHSKSPSKEVVLDLINQGFLEDTEDSRRKRAACEQRYDALLEIDISDAEYIDQRLREFLRWSAMKEFVYEAFQGLEKSQFDSDLPKKARQALAKGEKTFSAGLEWRSNVYARIHEDVNESESSRVPTGITHFDQEIGGGLKGGELGIILAVPKGFKSGTMLNFAYGAMQQQLYRGPVNPKGANVVYFTLELSERLVASRFDRRCSLMTRDQMVEDPSGYAARLEMMQNTVLCNSKLFIKGYKSKQATCDTFRAYLDRMIDEGIEFCEIIVDYLDLVKSNIAKTKKDSWDDAALICEDLRDVAIEYNVPIWTACRATRDAVGKPFISMNHMSKSFERIGVADMVIAACQTEEEKANGEMRLAMVAARNDAGDKQVNCKVNYPLMKLVSHGVSQIEFEEDFKKMKKGNGGDKMLSKVKAVKAASSGDDEDD